MTVYVSAPFHTQLGRTPPKYISFPDRASSGDACSYSHRAAFAKTTVKSIITGTVGIYLSASTGDAAKEFVSKTPEITEALEKHESLGSIARVVFTILTVFFAALQYHPKLLKRQLSPMASMMFYISFLLIYTTAALLLYNTAHSGGLLVHKLGVHANIF